MSSKAWACFTSVFCFGFLCGGVCAGQTLQGGVTSLDRYAPVLSGERPSYTVPKAIQTPAMDGNAESWRSVPAIALDKKEQTGGEWSGTNDLSGALRMVWDDAGLYFRADVVDDVHHAPNTNSFWENDGIQFGFDPYLNGSGGGFNREDITFCISDTPKGALVSRYKQRGKLIEKEEVIPASSGVLRRVARAPGSSVTVYEWFMPWKELMPVSPWVLGKSRFSFSVNDNDGKGFKGAIFWTPGVVYSQNPSKFGEVIFDGATASRAAMLGVPPEMSSGTATNSAWVSLPGVAPFYTARMLVRADKECPVTATVTVVTEGRKKPVAKGVLQAKAGPGHISVIWWDLSSLPDGRYDVTYELDGAGKKETDSFQYGHLRVDRLKNDMEQAAAQFAPDRPWDDLAGASPLIRKHRGMFVAARQWLDGAYGISDDEKFASLVDARRMLEDVLAGKDYLGNRRGGFWFAYYSQADGSGQPFLVSLPDGFDPSKTYPLAVRLHGGGHVVGVTASPTRKKEFGDFIIVDPWGRGSNSYRGLGENDVLEVIRFMKQWYRIDPARVYVYGGSMGGFGTWALSTRYPDLFAAAIAYYGGVYGVPFQNLRNVPVFVEHGARDWLVPVDQGRYAVQLLEEAGCAVAYKEHPLKGHDLGGSYPACEWLGQFQRPDKPAEVTDACQEPGKAYWLEVKKLSDPHLPAEAKARVFGKGAYQTVTLSMKNVETLGLDVSAMPMDRKRALIVQAGLDQLTNAAPLPPKLYVQMRDGKADLSDAFADETGPIRPYMAGAAASLYRGEPLMIVYGTGGGEPRTAIYKKNAEALSLYAGAGSPMPVGIVPIKADRDFTAEDQQHFNLLLIGNQNDNSVVAAMMGRLPIAINEKMELFAGDREPVSVNGAMVRLACYNPLALRRAVFLLMPYAGDDDTRKWLTMSDVVLPRFVGTYVATNYKTIEDKWRALCGLLTGASGMNPAREPDLIVQAVDGAERRVMQFTHGWQWEKDAGADRKIPRDKVLAREVVAANLRVMQRVTETDFAWGDFRDKADSRVYDPDWFTLADLSASRTPEDTLIATVSGDDLIEIYNLWVAKDEVAVYPAYTPKDVDPKRIYRLSMRPGMAWYATMRKKNMLSVTPGPQWHPQSVWKELFAGQK